MRYSIIFDIQGRTGSQHIVAPCRIYPCKDGYVHLAVLRAGQWRSLLKLIGNPETLTDSAWDATTFRRRNVDIIDPIVTEFTMSHTKEEIVRLCQDSDIPATPVNNTADFCEHIHVKERGFITEIEHPVIGRHRYLGPAYRLGETPCEIGRPAPLLGQHNKEVYCGDLGYSDKELAELRAEGTI